MAVTVIRKTADSTVVNSTTLVDDSELQVTLAASAVYRVRLVAHLSGGSTADVKYALKYTGTLLASAGMRAHKNMASPDTVGNWTQRISGGLESWDGTAFDLPCTATASQRAWAVFDGFVMTDTSGLLSIQFAQNTLHATQTAYLHKGSWLAIERIDIPDTSATILYVQKQADQSKTSDTTFADDSELQLALAANTTYLVEAVVLASVPLTGDMKLMLKSSQDLNSSFDGRSESITLGEYGGAQDYDTLTGTPSGDGVYGPNIDQPSISGHAMIVPSGNNSWEFVLRYLAVISTGASAPTLGITWAQNASDANATKVLKGSFITAYKI